jgi:hypothetical protein
VIFGDSRIGLEARDESGSPYYAVVKAHSLATIRFALTPGDSEQPSVEKLQELLKNHKVQDFELEVITSDGKLLKTSGRFE